MFFVLQPWQQACLGPLSPSPPALAHCSEEPWRVAFRSVHPDPRVYLPAYSLHGTSLCIYPCRELLDFALRNGSRAAAPHRGTRSPAPVKPSCSSPMVSSASSHSWVPVVPFDPSFSLSIHERSLVLLIDRHATAYLSAWSRFDRFISKCDLLAAQLLLDVVFFWLQFQTRRCTFAHTMCLHTVLAYAKLFCWSCN